MWMVHQNIERSHQENNNNKKQRREHLTDTVGLGSIVRDLEITIQKEAWSGMIESYRSVE